MSDDTLPRFSTLSIEEKVEILALNCVRLVDRTSELTERLEDAETRIISLEGKSS